MFDRLNMGVCWTRVKQIRLGSSKLTNFKHAWVWAKKSWLCHPQCSLLLQHYLVTISKLPATTSGNQLLTNSFRSLTPKCQLYQPQCRLMYILQKKIFNLFFSSNLTVKDALAKLKDGKFCLLMCEHTQGWPTGPNSVCFNSRHL